MQDGTEFFRDGRFLLSAFMASEAPAVLVATPWYATHLIVLGSGEILAIEGGYLSNALSFGAIPQDVALHAALTAGPFHPSIAAGEEHAHLVMILEGAKHEDPWFVIGASAGALRVLDAEDCATAVAQAKDFGEVLRDHVTALEENEPDRLIERRQTGVPQQWSNADETRLLRYIDLLTRITKLSGSGTVEGSSSPQDGLGIEVFGPDCDRLVDLWWTFLSAALPVKTFRKSSLSSNDGPMTRQSGYSEDGEQIFSVDFEPVSEHERLEAIEEIKDLLISEGLSPDLLEPILTGRTA